MEEKDKLIRSLLEERRKYKDKVLKLLKKYKKLAKDYIKMYNDFKELNESLADPYKRSFTVLSSTKSNDELSITSLQNEEKINYKDELVFSSTVKNERIKMMDSFSPDSTLSFKKRTFSQKLKDELGIKIFSMNKTLELNESTNNLNYDRR